MGELCRDQLHVSWRINSGGCLHNEFKGHTIVTSVTAVGYQSDNVYTFEITMHGCVCSPCPQLCMLAMSPVVYARHVPSCVCSPCPQLCMLATSPVVYACHVPSCVCSPCPQLCMLATSPVVYARHVSSCVCSPCPQLCMLALSPVVYARLVPSFDHLQHAYCKQAKTGSRKGLCMCASCHSNHKHEFLVVVSLHVSLHNACSMMLVPQVTLQSAIMELYESNVSANFTLTRSGDTRVRAMVFVRTRQLTSENAAIGM